MKQNLVASLNNVRQITEDAHGMSVQLRRDMDDLVGSSKGNLKDLGGKVNSLLDHVDATIQDTDSVVQKLTEQVTDPHLQQSLQETADLARTTLSRFNQIASDIHALTGDPEFQGDIKKTMANLSSATERGQHAIEKVDQILDKVTGSKPRVPRLPKIDLIGNVSEQISPTRMRVDIDAMIPIGSRGLFDLGLYDFGQNTRLNAQMGNRFNDKLDVRYGLYASKIGAGLDYWVSPGTGFRADLWDTSRVRLDARGLFRVNKSASVWIGSDNLLRTPIPIVGVQLTQ
jgi:phospholipid/cholesterol/gamma-HCH transport system substrate-binding protein